MIRTTRPLRTKAPPLPSQKSALDEMMPLVYGELRRMALGFLRRERPNHTLQPTALAHEVYLRLAGQRRLDTRDRLQFFGLAAQMMRRILINYAEAHMAAKRGSALQVSLTEIDEAGGTAFFPRQDVNILALNDALTNLGAIDSEKVHIVELRFFAGLTMAEIAALLGKSLATVEREWSLARAWLYREVSGRPAGGLQDSRKL